MHTRRRFLASAAALTLSAPPILRFARASDRPGVTNTEIKIGQTMPYSGPVSAYGIGGRVELAYFKMINEQGGVNGRKINLISLDDGYSPPKTVEQVRRLVEEEQVAFLFQCLGTPTNLAIREYCNDNEIPQLLCASGSSKLDDPENFPWTTTVNQIYKNEARVYAKYILKEKPSAKIAVLYQNDDFGKDYLTGLKDGLGHERAGMIVKEASYEVSDPTVHSQVTTLQGSGADIFLIAATSKFAAQAILKSYDLGWSATRILSGVSVSVTAVLKPVGLQKATGTLSIQTNKDPNDPHWKDDPGMKGWEAFTDERMTHSAFVDQNAVYGYTNAMTLVHILKQCGDDLSRNNILRAATTLDGLELPTLLPGIRLAIKPGSYSAIHQMNLAQFNGVSWQLFGDLIET